MVFPVPEDYHDWVPLALGCAPLLNDTDPDGDPLSVDLAGQPAHGEAMVIENDPTDWLSYRPAKDYSTPVGTWVSDTIPYRAFDGQAYSNIANYRLWVAPVNDPPTFTPGPAPQLPTVQQLPTTPTAAVAPAPTTPAVTAPGNRGNGNGGQ